MVKTQALISHAQQLEIVVRRNRAMCFSARSSLRAFLLVKTMTDKSRTAVFIGNRDYYKIDKKMIENAIINAIDSGIDTFLNGGQGFFDKTCALILHGLKPRYPHIRSILVIPYRDFWIFNKDVFDEIIYPFEERIEPLLTYKTAIPLRNRVLVESAGLAICYVKRVGGGSWKTLQLAKQQGLRIIDLTA